MSGVEKVLLNIVGITHLYVTPSFIDPTIRISLEGIYCIRVCALQNVLAVCHKCYFCRRTQKFLSNTDEN
jgi:hypothetical protein